MRESSRKAVRELEMLAGRFGEEGLTPTQCHALQEIHRRPGVTPAELADELCIDRSTASRTVQALVNKGQVHKGASEGDGRRKPVRVTGRGEHELESIHRAADQRVAAALASLSEDDRRLALEGMEIYARALERSRRAASIRLRPIVAADDPAMARIIRSVMTEFGAVGAGFSIEDEEVDAMSRAYDASRSFYLVALEGERVLGGAGIAPLAGAVPEVCELRKMYLLPQSRGLGVGRALLERCLEGALELGYRKCYLETLGHMGQAQRLYRSFGFRPLEEPLGETGHFSCDAWFEKELGPQPTEGSSRE